MSNGMVQPAIISQPNIAGAMMQGRQIRGAQESRNIARQQLEVSRGQARTSRMNAATAYEQKQFERARSVVDFSIVLFAGVEDQASWEESLEKFLTVFPPEEQAAARKKAISLFGDKFTLKRKEAAMKQLAAVKGQLDKIMPRVVNMAKVLDEGGVSHVEAAPEEVERFKALGYERGKITGAGKGDKATDKIGQFFQMKGRKPKNEAELKQFLIDIRPPPQPTVSERELLRRQKAMGKLQKKAATDPNTVYRQGYQMDDDGSLFIDPVDNAPVKLRSFDKVLGKRGTITAIKTLGEQWDDAKEIQTLLQDPKVLSDMQSAATEAGLWDRVKGTWGNEIKLWMQKSGIGANTKTYEAIIRMQRYASEERKRFLGTAVTAGEIQTAIPWLPDAGDSFEVMTNKIGVAAREGEEQFRRWMDMYKNLANMSPLYKAFGIQRFDGTQGQTNVGDLSDEELLRQLGGT